MQTFVINIRPSQQEAPNLVRVHRNNLDMAHRATGTIVLLYASREEIQHGYLGTAELVDVVAAPDAPHQIVLILDQIRMFDSPISPTFIFGSDQSDDAAGPGGFHAYSRGVRPLTREHYNRIIDAAAPPRFGDFSEKSSEAYSVSGPEGRERRAYEALVRSRRLRFDALEHYGLACAVTRMKLGPASSLRHEVDICHIIPVASGGEDEVNNVLPLLRSVHWTFDTGLFTIRPNRDIAFRHDAPAELVWLFRGNRQAFFPTSPLAWPKAENLDFHYNEIFSKVGLPG